MAGHHAAHPLMGPPLCARLESGKVGSGMAMVPTCDARGPGPD